MYSNTFSLNYLLTINFKMFIIESHFVLEIFTTYAEYLLTQLIQG